MTTDIVSTAASAAALSVAVQGAPPDMVVFAALVGAMCSAYLREGAEPQWSTRYAVATLMHIAMSLGVGLGAAQVLPALWAVTGQIAPPALTFFGALFTHLIIPTITELRTALTDRLRSRITGGNS